jgi:hypothetical protein
MTNFETTVSGRPLFIKTILELSDPALLNSIEEALSINSLKKLFPSDFKELLEE